MSTPRPAAPALLLALALSLSACGEDQPTASAPLPAASLAVSPEDSPAAAPATDRPPSTATPTPTASVQDRAVALYWLGATADPRGPRLYREFVRLPAMGDPVRQAVAAMLDRDPGDPDHDSLWADGTEVRDVRRSGSTAVIDLSREALTNGGGSAFEAATVQQLVHTATAADPSLAAVELRVEGKRVETRWGAVGTAEPLRRAPAAEVLGPVWIDAVEGQDIGDRVGGSATVFEATVSWDLQRNGRTAQEGFSTATEGAPGRGTWTAELDVAPGDYLLRAWESSAKDGSVTWLETRNIRVSR